MRSFVSALVLTVFGCQSDERYRPLAPIDQDSQATDTRAVDAAKPDIGMPDLAYHRDLRIDTTDDVSAKPDSDEGFDLDEVDVGQIPVVTPEGGGGRIAAGFWHSCAASVGDEPARCWGLGDDPEPEPEPVDSGDDVNQALPPAEPLVVISAGRWNTCGLRTDGSLTCWGRTTLIGNLNDPPTGAFQTLSVGSTFGCAINNSSSIQCWGADGGYPYYRTKPPQGDFADVDVFFKSACAVESKGGVQCWGSENPVVSQKPVLDELATVVVGGGHACALRGNGKVVCWGLGSDPAIIEGTFDFDQAAPPPGLFTQLAASLYATCGLRPDGRIECWGGNDFGEADAPSGSYVAISLGDHHGCAIGVDDRISCWGDNRMGQATPPDP